VLTVRGLTALLKYHDPDAVIAFEGQIVDAADLLIEPAFYVKPKVFEVGMQHESIYTPYGRSAINLKRRTPRRTRR
jgi:hypothetical protein